MATLGQTGNGFTFTVNAGSGWGDFAGGSYTVPSPGIIVSAIHAYVGNGGTTQNCRLYVWQASGGIPGTWLIQGTLNNLLGLGLQTQNSLTAHAGTVATSDLYLPAGTVIWIGAYLAAGSGQLSAASGSGGGTELGNTSDGNWSDHGPASVGQMCAYIDYTPLPAPTLSGASPTVAAVGQTTTLTGTNLLHTSSITVCGVNAPTYTINSDTSITVTVPNGAAGSGTIVVTTPAGTASTPFTAGGIIWVNTGTPASPVWTAGQVVINTGTPAAPNWVAAEVDVNTGTPASPIWTPGG